MSTTITLQSLDNSLRTIRASLDSLETRMETVENRFNIYVSTGEFQSQVRELENSMSLVNTSIATIEEKLEKIVLPEDTKYYLQESEITDFRNHFRQLRTLMSEVDRTRIALIRLASRYQLTNSQL